MDCSAYWIEDPRPIAVEAPYTFFLPSEVEIAAISKGDLVKLTFQYADAGERWSAERMWVTVETVGPSELIGRLSNEPDEPSSPLRNGDTIAFHAFHVLDIVWERPEEAPPRQPYREFWDRCLVDRCVLDGDEPVEYLYREEPDMDQDGDRYPDSGWRVRGRMGEATNEEYDTREVKYVALGAVLNEDDSWLHLIDAPIGSHFRRDFDHDVYLPALD